MTIRVRQHPPVVVEQAVIGAACVTVSVGWTDPGWPSTAGLLVGAAVLALLVLRPAFVADADGLTFSKWWWPWRRHLRWDQAHAVRLVPGSFERPGRRIEVLTAAGWVPVGSPRDGWFVRDQRLEGLVEELWRRVPPRAVLPT